MTIKQYATLLKLKLFSAIVYRQTSQATPDFFLTVITQKTKQQQKQTNKMFKQKTSNETLKKC